MCKHVRTTKRHLDNKKKMTKRAAMTTKRERHSMKKWSSLWRSMCMNAGLPTVIGWIEDVASKKNRIDLVKISSFESK
jgi:L-rhamnose isomerase